MTTMVDAKDFLHAFHGLDFPASRSQIVGAAKDKGGLNGDVLLILEQIPERMYSTMEDLTAEIQRVYEPTSTAGEIQSASATAVSEANQELQGEIADEQAGEAKAPTEDGKAQAAQILARNRELVDGVAAPSPAGEAATGVGHMVNTDRSHARGDSSND
jgi:Protein of unknown function (DUF2795)